MKHIHNLACLAAVAAIVVAAGPAAAKDMRFPDKGDVAFVLHIPDAEKAEPDGSGNLIVTSPDHGWARSLGVTHDKAFASKPYDDMAKEILVAANAKPFSKHQPGTIGGKKAEAYYTTLVNAKNTTANVKLLIISEQAYVVTESIIPLPKLAAAQQKSLDTAVKSITLSGIK
jgi:hypothetical protein